MKKWERDKWKHFWVGIPLGMVLLAAALYVLPDRMVLAGVFALSLLIFICFMFEVLSLITDLGFYEIMDAVAGIAGGILGMIVFAIIKWLF